MEHIILFYLFESMDLIQTSRIKKITVSLVSLQLLLLVSIFISPVLGNGLSADNNNSVKENVKSLSETEIFSDNDTRTTVVSFTNQSAIPITKITNLNVGAISTTL
jgi:hypothetical protein